MQEQTQGKVCTPSQVLAEHCSFPPEAFAARPMRAQCHSYDAPLPAGCQQPRLLLHLQCLHCGPSKQQIAVQSHKNADFPVGLCAVQRPETLYK
jgi:hypothetical protein